ncbi:MAG: hypothetical protein VXV96_01445 [Bdellovibrionota bacterium]|jgi:hypothetical protein|nr:hypothetical protein [Bdellovibrionota bacterium]
MADLDVTVDELVAEERKFLHDISNNLLVAQGMGSFLEKALKKNEGVGEKEIQRIEKVNKAVKELGERLQARRERLHSLSKD